MKLRRRHAGSAEHVGFSWLRRLLALRERADPLFTLPEVIDKPEGSRVLVLAPHADDETLGCGGAVYKHHLAGDKVTAVFMTDGSQGHEMARGLRGQALVEAREREAREAGALLGISESVFLRNPDTALEASDETVGQLGHLLESLRPEVLYAPSPLDIHRDHRVTCLIAARALAACSWAVRVYLYEVWAPVLANCAVAIDLEHKIQAVRAYRSQMDERELYIAALTNLARYRGVTCLPGQNVAAECFLRLDRPMFVELAQDMK